MLVVRLRVAWNGGVRLTGCGSVDDALSVSMVNGAVELFLRGEGPPPRGRTIRAVGTWDRLLGEVLPEGGREGNKQHGSLVSPVPSTG